MRKRKERSYLTEAWHVMLVVIIIIIKMILNLLIHGRKSK